MIYLQLFWEFFKTGLFAIGGGLATLPFLYDMADKTGWFTHQDVANMLAISESTPGPIGVNMATYVGYETAGVLGGIVATLGLITPSIIIILIIAGFIRTYADNRYLQGAFYGLRPASTALIAAACVGVIQSSLLRVDFFKLTRNLADLFNWKAVILAGVLLVLTNLKPLKKIHPVVFLALSAVVGIIFKFT